jgi:hypothetical protein
MRRSQHRENDHAGYPAPVHGCCPGATFPFAASAQTAFPAILVGHSVLPAKTFIAPPDDAPESLKTSGKYTTRDGHREDRIESIPGSS